MGFVDIVITAGSTNASVEVPHSIPNGAGTLIPFIQLYNWNSVYDKPQTIIRSMDATKLDINVAIKSASTSNSTIRCYWAVFAI